MRKDYSLNNILTEELWDNLVNQEIFAFYLHHENKRHLFICLDVSEVPLSIIWCHVRKIFIRLDEQTKECIGIYIPVFRRATISEKFNIDILHNINKTDIGWFLLRCVFFVKNIGSYTDILEIRKDAYEILKENCNV